MPANVGAVAPCRDRGAVVALADGIHALDLESGATTPVALIEDLPPGVVLNDGKVDRRGRFVVGTIDTKIAAPLGQFLSLQAGELRVIADGFTVGNGPCWSPDDRVLYLADSFAHRIYAYDYDIETGDVGDRRIFAETQALGGIPDGATVDEEGMVWVAICEGAKVVAFAPDGEVQRVIEMPVSHPSSVTFGGRGLDLLYVTSIDPAATWQGVGVGRRDDLRHRGCRSSRAGGDPVRAVVLRQFSDPAEWRHARLRETLNVAG